MKHGERERGNLTSIYHDINTKYVQLHTRTFKDTHIFLAKDFHDFITEAMLGLAAPRYMTDSRVSLDLWIFSRTHQLRDQGEQQVQWHGFGIKPFLKRVGVTNIIEFILTWRRNEQTQREEAFALPDRLDLIGIELAEHLHNNFGMAGMIGRLEFHEVLSLWDLLCLVATPSIFDPRFVWFDWKLCWCWIAKFHEMPGLYFLAGILEIKSLKCSSCWKWQKICLNEMWLSL